MKVLLTGVNGFIGKALALKLLKKGYRVVGSVRSEDKGHIFSDKNIEIFQVEDIDGKTDWKHVLHDIDVVVHLAARVHVMKDFDTNPLDSYRLVNVAGTERLAQQAYKAGVKRFIYLSSIKVNGEERLEPYTENDFPSPVEPYGFSKWEAEQLLWEISQGSDMEVVVIRPPLVYGPEVRANFLQLLVLVNKGLPLPFGSLSNKRSMIYLGNLVDVVSVCLEHPDAAGQTFLISDGQDLSVTELIKMIAKTMGARTKLIPVSKVILNMLAKLFGRSSEIRRLTKPLRVDTSLVVKRLGWTPPFTAQEGVKNTINWFRTI